MTQAIVDKDNTYLTQRSAMTLVIELEQCFHSIAQMERRGLSSGLNLPNEWFFHKQEAWKKVDEEDPNCTITNMCSAGNAVTC
jgi:hypothetical protein